MHSQVAAILAIKNPRVAALGLFATNFTSQEAAVGYIVDVEEGEGSKYRHPFIGSLPDRPPFDVIDDNYSASSYESSKVCLICGTGQERHKSSTEI